MIKYEKTENWISFSFKLGKFKIWLRKRINNFNLPLKRLTYGVEYFNWWTLYDIGNGIEYHIGK